MRPFLHDTFRTTPGEAVPEGVLSLRDLLDTVQVKTPERATDLMLNGWLLYQALACRTEESVAPGRFVPVPWSNRCR